MKWFKKLSGTEKGMIIFIILLIIGIIIRWGYISTMVTESWRHRFSSSQQEQPADTVEIREPQNN